MCLPAKQVRANPFCLIPWVLFWDGAVGRILSGSGTRRNVTLSNTFVMRTIPDSVKGVLDTAKEAAVTMQMGGGIGFDFSTLRPQGAVVRGLDCPAAGPLASPASTCC